MSVITTFLVAATPRLMSPAFVVAYQALEAGVNPAKNESDVSPAVTGYPTCIYADLSGSFLKL